MTDISIYWNYSFPLPIFQNIALVYDIAFYISKLVLKVLEYWIIEISGKLYIAIYWNYFKVFHIAKIVQHFRNGQANSIIFNGIEYYCFLIQKAKISIT